MANKFSVPVGRGYGHLLTEFGDRMVQSGERRDEREGEQIKKEYIAEMKSEASKAYNSGDIDMMMTAAINYPEIGDSMRAGMQHKSKETEQDYDDTLFNLYVDRTRESALKYITARQKRLGEEGADSTETDAFMDRFDKDPEGVLKGIESELIFRNPVKMGKLLERTKPKDETKLQMGTTEILEDGTTISVTNKGTVVSNPEGKVVTGKDAAEAVKAARAQKVSNLREAAGEKKKASLEADLELKAKVEAGVIGAKEAAKISVKAFQRLEDINKNIRNIDEAIGLLDDGAETGVIDSKLPSVRSASIKLDNLQGRLGLDVLNTTTFGALSAGELKFALSTALPVNLGPVELRKWLVDKKAAQEKLSDYLEASAIYLGQPGNTVSGWIKKQKEKKDESPKYKEGDTATGAGDQKMVFRNGNWEAI